MSIYDPDSQPFDLKLSNLPNFGAEAERSAMVDVCDSVDFAKRILLQLKVKNFTAADVVRVSELILQRIDAERAAKAGGRDDNA